MKIDRAFKTIFISISSIFLTVNSANAQLVPDRSLGRESSVVVPVSNTRDDISGGARRGSNLFHSFREFNVNTNREVYFNNPSGVENIINRVTGSNVSNIFGTLGVDGNANLYLINPNGIVFGDGAFLDINGTFIGTTADGVRLGANDVYSASDPGQSSLLTIRPEALFVNRKNAQIRAIRNQGNLEVKSGSNLTLSADEINNSGSITNPGGNVFLEAVNGEVNPGNIDVASPLVNEERIGNGGNIRLKASGNINVRNGSRILTDGLLGGNINIESQRELVVNNASISSSSSGNVLGNAGQIGINTDSMRLLNGGRIVTNTSGSGNGGNIEIRARSIELIGRGIGLFTNVTERLGAAGAGNIFINTDSLRLEDGARIVTSSGRGKGGNIKIEAKSIELISGNLSSNEFMGIPELFEVSFFSSGLFTRAVGQTDAGNIFINTDSLRLEDGAEISTSNILIGNKAGNITIEAKTIELIGGSVTMSRLPIDLDSGTIVTDVNFFPSRLGTVTAGEGGNITINTEDLRLEDGAEIINFTVREGKGDNLTVNAKRIELIGGNPFDGSPSLIATQTTTENDARNIILNTDFLRLVDGAAISTATFAEGNAGNITISNLSRSSGKVEIIGVNPISGSPSGLFSSATNGRTGTGNGGTITITTKQLNILDGGIIDSSNFQSRIFLRPQDVGSTTLGFRDELPGLGEAGAIDIKAEEIVLNRGRITANGNIRGGGNINIDSSNFIKLVDRSEISTDVGQTRDFPGGNINIKTPLIIANPDNNRISATAITSAGGNINITTNAIFGYPQFLSIDASSSQSIDGTISIEGLTDEIRRGELLTPTPVIDAEAILANDVCAVKDGEVAGGSSFTIPGKGGITPSPLERVERSRGIVEWSEKPDNETRIRQNNSKRSTRRRKPNSVIAQNSQKPKKLQPAVGWYRRTDGTVVLTDNPALVRPLNQPIDYPTGCGN